MTPNTEHDLATGKFKRASAFARFEIKMWCMQLAYVVKKAKVNEGLRFFISPSKNVLGTRRYKKNENRRF